MQNGYTEKEGANKSDNANICEGIKRMCDKKDGFESAYTNETIDLSGDIEPNEDGFYPMELGNLLFGNSRGEYPLQPREKYDEIFVHEIMDKTDIDGYGIVPREMWDDKARGYDCDLFSISPYYWGDDEDEAEKPNFVYKPTGLEIQWYKYPFRDSYSNKKITPEELQIILKECAERYLIERQKMEKDNG